MATFVLIHGGGGSSWDWHLVAPRLRERGHDPIAVDLPSEDASAGWSAYVDVVLEAVGDRSDLVVVGHSLGGFTAPLVCARVPAKLLVLVAAMIPLPGETFADWWENTGYQGTFDDDVFYHDVRARARGRGASQRAEREREGARRALATRCVARDADKVSPLLRRPHVPGCLGASPRPGATRHGGTRSTAATTCRSAAPSSSQAGSPPTSERARRKLDAREVTS